VPEIRLIGASGEQLGIMPTDEAKKIARDEGIDLVEVAPTASPPVCRLMDYGKFKYEQAKKRKEARKNQHEVVLREVRMKPKIDDHDVEFKTRMVRKLIDGGDKVKVTITFRGREITHPQIGWGLLQRVSKAVEDVAVVERAPSMDGKRMITILAPTSTKRPKEQKQNAEVKNT
jgi:translation initiation factor IF-3